MAIHKTDALILRTHPYKETSLIVSSYTKSFGKINGLAKGVKRPVARYGSTFEPFSLNEIVFYQRKDSDLVTIAQCDLKDSFVNIRGNLTKTAYASYLSELTDEITELQDKNEELFQLLFLVLKLLDESREEEAERLIRIFEVKLLVLAGLIPVLDTCTGCGKGISHSARFSLSLGGVVCPNCFSLDSKAQPISKGASATIAYLQNTSLKEALRLKFTPKIAEELKRILSSFVEFQLEKPLKTLIFIKSVVNNLKI
jgi:DNA repair protein RecO (recombination protein O)